MHKSQSLLLNTAGVMTQCGFCGFSKCTGMLYGVTNRRWCDRIFTEKNVPDAEGTRKRSFFNLTTDPKHLSQSAHILLHWKKSKMCVSLSCHHSHPVWIINSTHLRGRGERWLGKMNMVLYNQKHPLPEMIPASLQEICATKQNAWDITTFSKC